MFCNNCGYKNDDYSNFCLQCGNKLEHRPIVSGTQAQSTGTNVEVPMEQPKNAASSSDIQGSQSQSNNIPVQGNVQPQSGVSYTGFNGNQQQNTVPYTGIPGNQQQSTSPYTGIPGNQPQANNPPQGSLPYSGFSGNQQQSTPYTGIPGTQQQGTPYTGMPGVPTQNNVMQAGSVQEIAPKKNRKRLLLIIPAVILIAVSIIAAVLLLRPKKAPIMDDILDALQGTLNSNSVAFQLSYKEESEDYGNNSVKAEGILEYDLDKGVLNFDITSDDQTEYILYEGTSYYLEDGITQYSYGAEDDLDMIFDYYKEYNKGLEDPDKVDWSDAIDEADLSSMIDGKKLTDCISELQKKLNDKDFYNKICKKFKITSKDKETTYSFDFDVPETVNSLIDILEPALNDGADDIKDFVSGPSEMVTVLSLKISVKDNRVTSMEFVCGYAPEEESEDKITIKLTLEDYNNASVDADKINEIISEAPSEEEAMFDFPSPSQDESVAIPTQVPEDTMESANLELWYMSYGNTDPLIEDNINRFILDNPQCNVNVSCIDYSEYPVRMATAMAAGEMPDIFMSYTDNTFYNYVRDGYVRSISDYMDRFNYKDQFLDASIAQASYADNIYAIPVGGTTMYGVFYNKDVFNRLGLSEPTTIEELEQICDTLLANGITPFELGNSVSFFGSIYFSCLSARKSGVEPFMEALNGNSYALQDGFLYAGNKLQEWVNRGYINSDCNSMDDTFARQELYNGNGAMYLNGSWNLATILSEAPDFYSNNMGFFEFPAYSAGDANSRLSVGTFGDAFYSISSSCENPEAAFEAITYLVDSTAVEQRLANNTIPPLKDYVPDDMFEQEIMSAAKQCTNVHQIYGGYLPTDASNEFYNSLTDIFGLTRTPQEIFDSIITLMPAD